MNSSVAKNVRNSLRKIEEGEVFDYSRFKIAPSEELAVAKELSRLSRKGVISRLTKGRYLKPKQSRFGPLQPAEDQVIRSLTYKNNRPIGYVTGITLYNQLGLTTQVSNVLVIARTSPQPATEIEGYKVKFVRGNTPRSEGEVRLLQLLDVLRDIKKIPDTSIERALIVLVDAMKHLEKSELEKLVKLALDYNPSTRALLGALLQQFFPSVQSENLRKSLNVFSSYRLNIDKDFLKTKDNWAIE